MNKSQRKQLIIALTSMIIVIGFIVGVVLYATGNPERAFNSANDQLANIRSIELTGERSYSLIGYEKTTSNQNIARTKSVIDMKVNLDNSQYDYKITDATDNTGSYTRIIYSDGFIYTNTPELGWSKIDKETANKNNIPTFYFDPPKMLEKIFITKFADEDKHKFLGEEDLNGLRVYSYDIELSEAQNKVRKEQLTKALFEEFTNSNDDLKIEFTELKYNIKVYKDTYEIAQQNISYTIEFRSKLGTLLLNNGKEVENIVNINNDVKVYAPVTVSK